MKLYPAIDIKNGQCVRLRQGKFDDVIIYSNNPVDIAKEWEACGASFIHLVDLDGALCGHAVNAEVIRKIASTVNIPVEVGGGIRNIKDIEDVLALGVSRVIIGTKAVENPNFIKEAVDKFGADKIGAGVDAKDGLVAIHGWEKVSNIKAVDLCMEMKKLGIKTIIYTDISKDGMLSGPNVYQTKLLSVQTGLDIIASGGVSGLKDLELVDEAGIHGAIIGKALYEKKIDLRQAVAMFER